MRLIWVVLSHFLARAHGFAARGDVLSLALRGCRCRKVLCCKAASRGDSGAEREWSVGSMVAAQDAYGAWYVAEVLARDETRAAYFVHYVGWEESWDEWVQDWRLATLSGGEARSTEAELEKALSPEALAERQRESLLANDMWQFAQFAESFEGSFEGVAESYSPDGKSLGLEPFSLSVARCDDEGGTAHENWKAVAAETQQRWALHDVELRPIDFRGDSQRQLKNSLISLGGTAANANAFTTAKRDANSLVCDLWIRKGVKLLGLRVGYTRKSHQQLRLTGVDLAKLTPAGLPPQRDHPTLGSGIPDPHPHFNAQSNVELRLPDKITCAFPVAIGNADKGVVSRRIRNAAASFTFVLHAQISLDWTVDDLRSQVDRVRALRLTKYFFVPKSQSLHTRRFSCDLTPLSLHLRLLTF